MSKNTTENPVKRSPAPIRGVVNTETYVKYVSLRDLYAALMVDRDGTKNPAVRAYVQRLMDNLITGTMDGSGGSTCE